MSTPETNVVRGNMSLRDAGYHWCRCPHVKHFTVHTSARQSLYLLKSSGTEAKCIQGRCHWKSRVKRPFQG